MFGVYFRYLLVEGLEFHSYGRSSFERTHMVEVHSYVRPEPPSCVVHDLVRSCKSGVFLLSRGIVGAFSYFGSAGWKYFFMEYKYKIQLTGIFNFHWMVI
jgi:hypothetical protein